MVLFLEGSSYLITAIPLVSNIHFEGHSVVILESHGIKCVNVLNDKNAVNDIVVEPL